MSQTFKQSPEIKACSTTQDRGSTAGSDLFGGLIRKAHELSRVERVGEVDYVYQMMGNPGELLGGRFGGADVEPTVHLHRVHRNNLAPQLFGHTQRDL